MTLIALLMKDGEPPILVSDLALSSPKGDAMPLERFPLQLIKSTKARQTAEFSSADIISFSQKLVIIGDYAYLWSGSYIVARSIANFILRNQSGLSPRQMQSSIMCEFSTDLREVAFIICSCGRNSYAWWHGCDVVEHNGCKIVCGGSGVYRFTTDFEREEPGLAAEARTVFRQAQMRISHMAHQELYDPNAYWHGIGGGYEIAALYVTGWRRSNYNMLYFSGNDGSFGLAKALTVSHRGHDTYIDVCSMDNNRVLSMENWRYLMSWEIERVDRFVVGDFLHRGARNRQEINSSYDLKSQNDFAAEFSIVSVAKQSGETGLTELGHWFYSPAVYRFFDLDGLLCDKSRAFFLREIEEFFLQRTFEPPADVVDFYKGNRAAWRNCELLIITQEEYDERSAMS